MTGFFKNFRQPFAGLSHWFGAFAGLAGIVVLLDLAWGNPRAVLAFSLYGIALVGLYTASGLYHSVHGSPRTERILRKFDHAGIFLLISGTYVPVCLLALSPQLGSTLLVLEGICAVIGIVATFTLRKFPSVLNVVLYILMGWMALGAMGYIGQHWPPYAVAWLVAGGVIYTIGAVIFSLDRPHLVPGKFSAHDLWHIFVLGGSACHFALMVTYVARLS